MSNALAGRTEGQEGQVLIAALGVAAGFSSSFLGIGGGLLLVPVLTGFLRCPIERAVGTSLATVVFISLAGVLAEWEVNGAHIRWTWALVLGAGSLVGTALGARIIARIPDAPLRLALAGVLLLSSVRMAAGSVGPHGALADVIAGTPAIEPLLVLSVGIVGGLTSVLFGVGYGIVTVPGLALVCVDLPYSAIRGTSLAAIVVAAALGARQHSRVGNVDARLTQALVPAGLAGAVLGVIAANFLPVRLGQMAFSALLVVVVFRLLSEVFHPTPWSAPVGRGGRRADVNAP
jgi:uncharacterized membrane protein YfcA